MTILGVSKDPVYIKKISLRIWTLRDELESIIARRVQDANGDNHNISIDDLKKEYAFHRAQEQNENLAKTETVQSPAPDSASDSPGKVEEITPIPPKTILQRRPCVPEEKVISAAMFLSEINMDNIYFFAGKELIIGQSVIIEFMVPKNFIMNGVIIYCHAYNIGGRIISNNRLPYRMGLKFTFARPGERTILRQFIQSIAPDVIAVKAAPETSEKKSSDSFDELDNLEF